MAVWYRSVNKSLQNIRPITIDVASNSSYGIKVIGKVMRNGRTLAKQNLDQVFDIVEFTTYCSNEANSTLLAIVTNAFADWCGKERLSNVDYDHLPNDMYLALGDTFNLNITYDIPIWAVHRGYSRSNVDGTYAAYRIRFFTTVRHACKLWRLLFTAYGKTSGQRYLTNYDHVTFRLPKKYSYNNKYPSEDSRLIKSSSTRSYEPLAYGLKPSSTFNTNYANKADYPNTVKFFTSTYSVPPDPKGVTTEPTCTTAVFCTKWPYTTTTTVSKIYTAELQIMWLGGIELRYLVAGSALKKVTGMVDRLGTKKNGKLDMIHTVQFDVPAVQTAKTIYAAVQMTPSKSPYNKPENSGVDKLQLFCLAQNAVGISLPSYQSANTYVRFLAREGDVKGAYYGETGSRPLLTIQKNGGINVGSCEFQTWMIQILRGIVWTFNA